MTLPDSPPPHGSKAASRTGRAPLSPRRRRLRWTVAGLVILALAGGGAGWWWRQREAPRPYRPDEQVAGITSSLSRNLPAGAPEPRFTDVTQAAGLGDFRTFVGDRTSQLPEDMGPGAAWGDFDNDGWDDLFLVSAGGSLDTPEEQLAPCALYRNLGNGKFAPVKGFPALRIHGMAAAWADYDGDGFLDLVVTGYQVLRLFHNEGGAGRFVRDARFPEPPGFWSGVAWGDYDRDRRPDLYVCNYVEYVEDAAGRDRTSAQLGTIVPYALNPSSYPGGRNLLFHNLGNGAFEEVAAKLGVTNPEGRSLGALWQDFDQDGWLDLYVANDVSDNVFFLNRQGRFQDLSHPAHIADYRSAMGLAAGDMNRDGDDDLFITHWVAQENALYNNLLADLAGGRIGQPPPPGGAPPASPSPVPRTTNAPPAASGPKPPPVWFIDVADQVGLGQVALQSVGWGCAFVDLDADGWLDLLVANGSTLEVPDSRPRRLKAEAPFLFWNRQGESFHDLAPLNPELAKSHVSRGLAVADYDGDGDQDFLIVHLGEGVQLFRNEMPQGHWLGVRLRSRNGRGELRGFGDGARVRAWLGQAVLQRCATGGSYLSQPSRTLHFGLGEARQVDRLEVHWPGGTTNVFEHLEADAVWELTEGSLTPRRFSRGKPPSDRPAGGGALAANPAGAPLTDKARQLLFWKHQRAAMEAMKVRRDYRAAAGQFRAALELDPKHEDAHYYLAQCLAEQGQVEAALDELAKLQQLNPQSHRAFQQWGRLRANTARTRADLDAAAAALERAHRLNPEETGAIQLLGEVELLRGREAAAGRHLAAVNRSNPRAVRAWFLRAYLAWKAGDSPAARQLLESARAALGPDWKPAGTTAEGDVRRKQHRENTPLSRFVDDWDGRPDPALAFAALEEFLVHLEPQPPEGGLPGGLDRETGDAPAKNAGSEKR